jgi:membrane protein DedA with SNARE-associated domain
MRKVLNPPLQPAMAMVTGASMPIWLREILISLRAAAIAATVVFATIVVGVLVAVGVGNNRPLVGGIAAIAFLLFVVLPVRLWWIVRKDRDNRRG